MTGEPEWAGFIQAHGGAEFVRVEGALTAPGTVRMDVPGRRLFGLSTALTAEPYGKIVARTVLAGEPVKLSGTNDGEVFTSRTGDGAGRRISVHAETDGWPGRPMLIVRAWAARAGVSWPPVP